MWELGNARSCLIIAWLLIIIELHCVYHTFPVSPALCPAQGGMAPCEESFFPSYSILTAAVLLAGGFYISLMFLYVMFPNGL